MRRQLQDQLRPAAVQCGGVIEVDSDVDEGSAKAAAPALRMTAVKQVAAKAPVVQPCPAPAKAAAAALGPSKAIAAPDQAAEFEVLRKRCAELQAELAARAAAGNPATPAEQKTVFTPEAKPEEKPVPCAPPTAPPSSVSAGPCAATAAPAKKPDAPSPASTVSSGPSASTASPVSEAEAKAEDTKVVDEAALSEQLDLSAPEACPRYNI